MPDLVILDEKLLSKGFDRIELALPHLPSFVGLGFGFDQVFGVFDPGEEGEVVDIKVDVGVWHFVCGVKFLLEENLVADELDTYESFPPLLYKTASKVANPSCRRRIPKTLLVASY